MNVTTECLRATTVITVYATICKCFEIQTFQYDFGPIKMQYEKGNYHLLGWLKGLYFLYFIFHSIISVQRAHSPATSSLTICFVLLLESCKVFLNADLF